MVVRSGSLTRLSSTPVTVTVFPPPLKAPPGTYSSGVNVSSEGWTVATLGSSGTSEMTTVPVGRLARETLKVVRDPAASETITPERDSDKPGFSLVAVTATVLTAGAEFPNR